jgi:PKD repeat protein
MTRWLSTWKGWLFAIIAAVFLTACDPIADIVVPAQVTAGVAAQFKSEILPANQDLAQGNLQYTWDFGDGTVDATTGAAAVHTYAQAGEYEITLSISDDITRKFGQAYISKTKVTVLAAGASAPLVVTVVTLGDQPVAGAQVTVEGVTAATDVSSQSRFERVALDKAVAVRVQAPGFVATALQLSPEAGPLTQARQVMVRLMPEAGAIPVEEIAAPGALTADTLSATVVLPANAFVDAMGRPATGAATVTITPWDITRAADMAAFPGARNGRDANGNAVKLVSFGMMDVRVVGADGGPLQLAPGKTAQIRMDLPTDKDEAGEALSIGDVIPLWHFDVAQGLWVREGNGEVVASSTAPSGLAVAATVSHFSSWNWDRVLGAGGVDSGAQAKQTTIRCLPAEPINGAAVLVKGCAINVTQTLANGSVLSDALFAAQGQIQFTQLVSTATIKISAYSMDEARRGALASTPVKDVGTTLDVILGDTFEKIDVPGSVPVINVPSLQLHFSDLPFTEAQLGMLNYPNLREVTFTQGANTFTRDFGGLYGTSVRFEGGRGAVDFSAYDMTPGVPGPFGPEHLTGTVNVSAVASFYVLDQQSGRWTVQMATLSTSVNLPVIEHQGPLLLAVSSGWGSGKYILWDDFPTSKAVQEGTMVTVKAQQVDVMGMPIGEPTQYETEVVSENGFSLYTVSCVGTGGWYVHTITALGASGLKTFTIKPIYMAPLPCSA